MIIHWGLKVEILTSDCDNNYRFWGCSQLCRLSKQVLDKISFFKTVFFTSSIRHIWENKRHYSDDLKCQKILWRTFLWYQVIYQGVLSTGSARSICGARIKTVPLTTISVTIFPNFNFQFRNNCLKKLVCYVTNDVLLKKEHK